MMNINISKKRTSVKVRKSDLDMGLNSRGGEGSTTTSLNHKPTSALDDDDTDDDDDNDDGHEKLSGREAVNRAIAKQQAAIRAQAAATAMSVDASIYDYDGVYDSIHTDRNGKSSTATTTTDAVRKSRYIEDLMKTAKVRKMERDIAYDRKVARDQHAEEEAEPEFRNKDRFITSSYQRQLEERHQYEQQESKRQKIEDEQDITKRSDGGFGITSFYGNLTKQQSHSTKEDGSKDGVPTTSPDEKDSTSISKPEIFHSFHSNNDNEEHSQSRATTTTTHPSNRTTQTTTTTTTSGHDRSTMRLLRDAKVTAARDRYFQRHPNINPVTME